MNELNKSTEKSANISELKRFFKTEIVGLPAKVTGLWITMLFLTNPNTGLLVMSRGELAEATDIHIDSVDRYLKILQKENLIWKHNLGQFTIYKVIDNMEEAEAGQPVETLFGGNEQGDCNWWRNWR
jgi:hypothetical protein